MSTNRQLIEGGLRFALGATGDIWYRAANGNLVHLAIPADHDAMAAAGTPYVLGIDSATDVPYWFTMPIAGVGSSPVTVEDGVGGFLIVFDENGDVVYA